MDKDTKTWLLAGAALCGIGFVWNKFKNPESSIAPVPYTSNYLNQAGGLLTKVAGNTGIGGGITTTQTQTASNTAVSQAQLGAVVDQVNTILSSIINPPPPTTPAQTVNADPNTKFTAALAWAKTAIIPATKAAGAHPPTFIYIATAGNIYKYDLAGKFISAGPDDILTRSGLEKTGYKIF
jgi:hypothetical protein